MKALVTRDPVRRRQQRGVALIMCLFALTLLSSIALGLIALSDTETSINLNFRSSQQAYFGAVAGIEEARTRMTPGMVGGIIPPQILPGTGAGSVIYILNPAVRGGTLETVAPLNPANDWFDDQLCHENYPGTGLTNPGAGIPCPKVAPVATGWWTNVNSTLPFTQTTAALNFKWARINLKVNATDAPFYVDGGGDAGTYGRPVCWDGRTQLVLPSTYTSCDLPPSFAYPVYKPVYVITAMAQGSRRAAQVQVAQNPPVVTNAAVASYYGVDLLGQLGVNGYDYCSCQAV